MAGVYHAERGGEVLFQTEVVHLDLGALPHSGDVLVGKAHLLGGGEGRKVEHVHAQLFFHLHNVLDGLKEEGRDLRDAIKLVDADTVIDQLGDGKDVVGVELCHVLQHLFLAHAVKLGVIDVVHADLQRADALQEGLLQRGADAHDLARGLHLSAKEIGGGGELVEGEAGELGDHVVKTGLKCRVGVGDLDLLQRHADGDLCRDARDGIAGCLGGKCGGTGYTGVDLDEVVLTGGGVKGELYVTAAGDLQLADQLDGGVVEHLVFLVGEGHDGSHHDGVARMYANGVDILHTADGDGVIGRVTHNLELDLLVALDGLLDQNLMYGGELERVGADLDQLLLVVGKATACAAEGECRTKHDRVADALSCCLCLLQIIGDLGGDNGLADRLAKLLEQLAVLSALDGFGAGAEQLNAAFLQHALLLQLHCQVQTRLTADTGNDRVGALHAQDLCNVFKRQGLHVHLVRDGGVGHDGRRVAVAKHDLIALFLERQARLRACVVELSRLSDDDGAGADDQDLFQICSFCHFLLPPVFMSNYYFDTMIGIFGRAERADALPIGSLREGAPAGAGGGACVA